LFGVGWVGLANSQTNMVCFCFRLIKRGGGYLRFRNSIVPSNSVMYSNPFSMSCDAPFMDRSIED